MPVTAKLSKEFYDRLGERVANELVEWLNSVDATYRANLKDLNELNFARFDAKLEQRSAELHARIDQVQADLKAKIDQLRVELNAKIDASIASLKAELIKWMFVFWAGTALGGLLLR